ncbi:4-hydroxythreonine-4-phosphate dehydrogenase PdxA [cyanobiont of Ornithocercus magnificus]|nr:4-hydroxythreonine-4-phosphate dehydrogenase PdxA [cyanobiont of Ornithocercus magnificus]
MPSQLSNSNHCDQRIVVALGDPAGIGMEVTLRALAPHNGLDINQSPLLVGCRRSLERCHNRLRKLGVEAIAEPNTLETLDLPLEGPVLPGKLSATSGAASFRWLTCAAELVLAGQGCALVTAPISKYAWHAAGHYYPGQTERLSELAGGAEASMLFTARSPNNGWRLNTLLATTHIPLAEVPALLNPMLIHNKLDVLLAFCRRFRDKPHLAIAGLNPHAGEQGHLGRAEVDWLHNCLDKWRKSHPEIQLDGPISPDTCWLSAGQAWHAARSAYVDNAPDGLLAMYHDQGLIPVKLLAFDEAVNTTLGLPFLRTSPDHGTGCDIAGQGLARPNSMAAAMMTAWELTAPAAAFP